MLRFQKSLARPDSWRMCSVTTACTRSQRQGVIERGHDDLILTSRVAASRRMAGLMVEDALRAPHQEGDLRRLRLHRAAELGQPIRQSQRRRAGIGRGY